MEFENWMLWLAAFVVFAAIEASGPTLLTIWFAVGALAAFASSLLGAGLLVQIIIFVIVSVIMLIFTRPLLKKLLPNRYIPTNAELDIGKNATVIEDIDEQKGTGRVRLNGVDWSAKTADGRVIPKDSVVTVAEVRSATLIVK